MSVEAPLRRTPFFDQHKLHGGRLVPFAGWELPVQYTGIVDEHTAVRTAAGLFDVSHMGELELSGEHARAVVNYLIVSDVDRLVDGQAVYTCACNEQGTILDDLIVYRRSAERFMIVCNASNHAKMAAHFAHAADHHCEFADLSASTSLLALQGPRAISLLESVPGGEGLGSLKSFHFRDVKLAGVPVTVARTGYTGEDGCEIFLPWSDAAVDVWSAIVTAGRQYGLKLAGLGARDTLRLEARLSLYGNEIDETTNPIEAGLSWIVHLSKGDFVGRRAIEAAKSGPLSRKMVGFEMIGRGAARHGYPILSSSGETIGVTTSGAPSPTLGKSIGLGYVSAEHAAVGTDIRVDCRGKSIDARVIKTPFYKRGMS